MTSLTVSATFTKNQGQPATGLTLSDLKFFLTQQDKATGVDSTVWDGTQVATIEINNVGIYTRILATADLTAYSYFAMVQHIGATVLDSNYVYGSVGQVEADTRQIEGVDATDQIRDSVLTDATRFAGANVATILAAVDTEVASILAAVDTEVAAIKAKTDNLPTDPADESNTQAAITAVLAAIAALNNPSTAAIVMAIFAGTMEGRAFEEIIKDIWAQVVGDFVANDDDDPTSIVYEGPNGATQLTHAITDTTRSWS